MIRHLFTFLLLVLWAVAGYGIVQLHSPHTQQALASFQVAHTIPGILYRARAAGPTQTLTVPILMYHHVGDLPDKPDAIRRDLTVSTNDFTAEVEWLANQGYHSVTLQQIYEATNGQGTLPPKPVAFTFDDGYQDVFDNAVPVLAKNGFVGSFAIITQFPGSTSDYASWDTIRSALNNHMEVVSHTQNHFDGSNPKYSYDFIKQNLVGSRQDLKTQLGIDAHIMVYPFGHYTSEYLRAARDAGFDMGLTVSFGERLRADNLMTAPRVRVHGSESMEKFQELVEGRVSKK